MLGLDTIGNNVPSIEVTRCTKQNQLAGKAHFLWKGLSQQKALQLPNHIGWLLGRATLSTYLHAGFQGLTILERHHGTDLCTLYSPTALNSLELLTVAPNSSL